MLTRVQEFAGLLRSNGVRVSSSEIIDAVRAVDAVGLADGGILREALRTSMIKRTVDSGAFDELFDLYFLAGAAMTTGTGAGCAELLSEAGLSQEQLAQVLAELAGMLPSMSTAARVGLGMGGSEIAQLVRRVGGQVDFGRMRTPLQVGYFSHLTLEALGFDAAVVTVRALLARLRASAAISEAQDQTLGNLVRRNFDQLRHGVREFVAGQFRQRNLDYMQQLKTHALVDRPLSQLSDDEIDSLRGEVRRLTRVLRARASSRHELKRRGRLDLRRTLRRSLATEGVPFNLIRRARQRRKPRLVVLCDISDSVRNVSRFMLMLVYALQEHFSRVDSFAFVAELGELTDLFRTCKIDRALELTYSGAAVNLFANSNYGKAFQYFAEHYADRVSPRTTVLVLGDGRNNYHRAHAEVLGELGRRAKQLWWLNPESPAAWGFGDSAMAEYEPHCDRVLLVNNLESLRAVVDQLIV